MPTLGVNVAILDDNNRLLLTSREDFDVWCLPGGEVEAGESLTQAALREAEEETGLRVRLTRLVGIYSRPGLSRFTGHIFVFAGQPVDGTLKPQFGETTDVDYFEPTGLPANLVQLAPLRIRHLLRGAGGSSVWTFYQDWPFAPALPRAELYRLRDGSGLKRGEFYRRYMNRLLPEGVRRELPIGVELSRPFNPRLRPARQENPAPVIAVIIAIIHDNKLLLTRREDFDVWCLPGGSLDPGESLAQAARREANEETGLNVALTRLVGVYTRLSQNGRAMHLVVFAARPVGGRLQPQPDEVLEIGEFGSQSLPDEMFLAHREMALDALAGVGGSCAWTQNVPWPFPPEMSRREMYALRDASGLSRSAFYREHFRPVQPDEEVNELDV